MFSYYLSWRELIMLLPSLWIDQSLILVLCLLEVISILIGHVPSQLAPAYLYGHYIVFLTSLPVILSHPIDIYLCSLVFLYFKRSWIAVLGKCLGFRPCAIILCISTYFFNTSFLSLISSLFIVSLSAFQLVSVQWSSFGKHGTAFWIDQFQRKMQASF